jgi:hypothetical protein
VIVFHDEADDIAMFLARPALIALPLRMDIKGRPMVLVKRAQSPEGRADLAQSDITADDIHDVVGLFDPGYQVIGQGVPTHWKSQEKPARAISPNLRVRRVCIREAVAEGVVLAGEIGKDLVCQRPFLKEGEDEEPGTAN